jgi:hypothetical protein
MDLLWRHVSFVTILLLLERIACFWIEILMMSHAWLLKPSLLDMQGTASHPCEHTQLL